MAGVSLCLTIGPVSYSMSDVQGAVRRYVPRCLELIFSIKRGQVITVSLAWLRRIGKCEELYFASDSRLSGSAIIMDYCPKILTLPRSDCAICFAGHTDTAYPLMTQLSLAIQAHGPLLSRAMDIRQLRSHALKIFDSMASSLKTDLPEYADDLENPSVSFIFGGYSWIEKQFHFWKILYSKREKRFIEQDSLFLLTHPRAKKVFVGDKQTARQNDNILLGRIEFGGDQGKIALNELLTRLTTKLNFDDVDSLVNFKLNMEPFEVIRDILRNPQHAHTVGGAPQIVKIYQHMNASPVAVYWPDKASEAIYLLGRPILGYENIDFWILDPDQLRTSHLLFSKTVDEPENEDE